MTNVVWVTDNLWKNNTTKSQRHFVPTASQTSSDSYKLLVFQNPKKMSSINSQITW